MVYLQREWIVVGGVVEEPVVDVQVDPCAHEQAVRPLRRQGADARLTLQQLLRNPAISRTSCQCIALECDVAVVATVEARLRRYLSCKVRGVVAWTSRWARLLIKRRTVSPS